MKKQNVYDMVYHTFKTISHLEELRLMLDGDASLIASVYGKAREKVGAFIDENSLEAFLDEAVQAVYDAGWEAVDLDEILPCKYVLTDAIAPINQAFFYRGKCYLIEGKYIVNDYVVNEYVPKRRSYEMVDTIARPSRGDLNQMIKDNLIKHN